MIKDQITRVLVTTIIWLEKVRQVAFSFINLLFYLLLLLQLLHHHQLRLIPIYLVLLICLVRNFFNTQNHLEINFLSSI
uniref:Uncharacterized protein n=1 Tax=Solanum lycopersicum TaxID=4081 RepID=A0A3Q7ETP5_SOLLC